MNKQTYTLLSHALLSELHMYRGPTKSIPVVLNGGDSLTLSAGRSGTAGKEMVYHHIFYKLNIYRSIS